MAVERVVLLGFMASGKTTVGRALAARLGWEHRDLDREIERERGLPVAEIFRVDGEAAFRALESAIAPRLLAAPRLVLSPGGGWAADPSRLASLPPGTLSVWLRATPATVLRRLREAGELAARPLLAGAGEEVEVRVEALLRAREPHYARADAVVETDGREVESIVSELEQLVRIRTG